MAWQRGEQWWSWAHIGDGTRRQIPLGTTSRTTAKEIERMLDILRGRRAWRLVRAAVVESVISLGALYDAFREGEHALQRIEAGLDDADLNQHVAGWQTWARKRASEKQVTRYVQMLRVLIPEGKPFPRSCFTRKLISQALSGLPGSGSTGRRYYTAWSSFGNFLVEIEVLEHNPVKDVKAPRENDPRENFLDLPDVRRLVDAQEEPFRTLAALREAAGVEISAALKVRVRDLGEGAGIVQAPGTKNAWRNRPVYVEPWARPYLLQLAKGKLPDAPLFDGVDYWDALASHRSALKALRLPKDYTLHDARHSFAVRWMRAGIDPNLIAANLGHKNAMLVLKVYGKHRPRALDLARLDVEKFGCSSGDSAAPVIVAQVA